MKGWAVIAVLFLAGCGGQGASNVSDDNKLIAEAKALEKRANDQVNETIATIEAENRESMAELETSAPVPVENSVVSSGNQN